MREILFRGKRVDNGEWVYGYYVKELDGSNKMLCDEGFEWDSQPMLSYVDVDPNTVGQYTGLKDKNGVMIYEGDTTKHSRHETIGTWIFSEHYVCFMMVEVTEEHRFYYSIDSDVLEIIGNTHDEPQGANA